MYTNGTGKKQHKKRKFLRILSTDQNQKKKNSAFGQNFSQNKSMQRYKNICIISPFSGSKNNLSFCNQMNQQVASDKEETRDIKDHLFTSVQFAAVLQLLLKTEDSSVESHHSTKKH
ncbi:hypothetical protein CHARACLAT_033159 [Characodon lateralis]|uniref:Uncharacterized protein n=1 Tax=Characodon lateralis TaxID=208331 RepID=A0ABU7F940_9TELE|nr:hypothetical protein [Characodon lateralis]